MSRLVVEKVYRKEDYEARVVTMERTNDYITAPWFIHNGIPRDMKPVSSVHWCVKGS